MSDRLISNVSDTARWVAVYRAWESARPDALFRDPLAERLAGDRGRAIAAKAPRSARNGWPMIARTKLIDDLVARELAGGCDRVINLAAGLDARPYRLDLPKTLTWIEADLPAITEEKERLVADATPHCNLLREKVDLADDAARAAFLARATDGAKRVLVLTEGLLVYLDESAVKAISKDLLAQPAVRSWVVDLASPALVRMMVRRMKGDLDNAPMKFGPADGVAFFEANGWRVHEVESMLRAAQRWKRLPWFMRLAALFPDPNPRRLRSALWSAVVRLEPR
jgi:methyltransferase (TIGR00027 family)